MFRYTHLAAKETKYVIMVVVVVTVVVVVVAPVVVSTVTPCLRKSSEGSVVKHTHRHFANYNQNVS